MVRKGVAFALGSAVLFGASAPAAKALLDAVSPQLLAGLLYLGSGLGLGIVRLLQTRTARKVEGSLSRSDLPWFGAAIVSGGVVGPVLLMIGLIHTPASSASLLLNLEAVFTAALAWIVFHENVDRRIALGMLSIVIGGVLLGWQGGAAWAGTVGPLAIASACLCWAIDNNLTQKVAASDAVQIAMLKGLCAGAVNTLIALLLGATFPIVARVVMALLLGFVSYGLSLVLFVLGLRHLGTARTGAYFSLAPFVGAAVSLVVFAERPAAMFWIAAALMALGLWLHVSERHEHMHAHDAMEHAHAHVHDEHHQHQHSADDPPGEPHTHAHRHDRLVHSHPHYPDVHHRHDHG
ncbi:MAG TPA: EamA family transporter [Gemmatimonadaceae bacterium]|nr:EamA family transporter [Gemmatimonadaceae bacterium]